MSVNVDTLDDFTRQYIETALWSTTDNACSCDLAVDAYASDGHAADCGYNTGGEPLDANYGIEDLDPICLAKMVKDCTDFQLANADLLRGLDLGTAGHDFWLTRNRHGAGFWDGDYPEGIGQLLTLSSRVWGDANLYVENGKIVTD